MRRKLFRLPAAAVLAVLFVAASLLWVRTVGRIPPATGGTQPPARFAGGQSSGRDAARSAASRPIGPSSTQAPELPRAWPTVLADAEIAAFQKYAARIDPTQLPAVRERWLQEWR